MRVLFGTIFKRIYFDVGDFSITLYASQTANRRADTAATSVRPAAGFPCTLVVCRENVVQIKLSQPTLTHLKTRTPFVARLLRVLETG